VVAQVHAAERHVLQAVDVVQRLQPLHPGLAQLFPARPVDEGARAQRIDHHPARHPAPRGGGHRVGDAAAGVVVQPDVEGDVHALAGLFDVGHQRVQRAAAVVFRRVGGAVGGAQQRHPVAAHRRQAVDRARQFQQRYRVVRHRDGRGRRHRRGGRAHPPQRLLHAAEPRAADAGFAQQQVRDHAHHRRQHHHRHPRRARGRRAVGAGQRARGDQQVRDERDGGDSPLQRGVCPARFRHHAASR